MSVMRKREQEISIQLRKKGFSLNEISERLGVPKSSVSNWVKRIPITDKQRMDLDIRSRSIVSIEKRRQSRIKNESAKRQSVFDLAKKDIKNLKREDLFLIGTMLYFAEGGKSQRGLVRLSNSDPRMIEIMMRYFREVCEVKESKFKGQIHTHELKQVKPSEIYWSEITGIPRGQFFKTYYKESKTGPIDPALKSKRYLQHGTFDIYVCDTNLFLKIQGWIQGIYEKLMISHTDVLM